MKYYTMNDNGPMFYRYHGNVPNNEGEGNVTFGRNKNLQNNNN